MFTIMKTMVLVTLLLSLSGCSDDGYIVRDSPYSFVAGYVKLDDVAATPVGGAQVSLVEYAYTTDFIPVRYRTGWSLTSCTKDTGYFSFKFDGDPRKMYDVEVAYHASQQDSYDSQNVHLGVTEYVTLFVPYFAQADLCN